MGHSKIYFRKEVTEIMAKNTIGKELRNFRKRAKLTQKEFAEKFNNFAPKSITIHARDVSKYETGLTVPVTLKYQKLKRFYLKNS
jgi:transcriptional regulator with XRE-family HTH domain